jgi:hypothetical protein
MRKILLLCLLSFLPLMRMQADPGWAPWNISNQSRQLLLKQDFKGLDALAAEVKAKGYDIRQADTEIDAFYDGFHVADGDTEEVWQGRLQLIQNWLAANPGSLSAHIALSNWWLGHGWRARGPGFADSVSDVGAATFEASAKDAADALDAVPASTTIDDPAYYATWVDVCRAQGRPKDEMFGYVNKSIALAKNYISTYLNAGIYLLERWYGEHGETEQWMKTWADSFPPEQGDVFYAFMLSGDARFVWDGAFKAGGDYDRAKNGLQKRISENDPAWLLDENFLLHLAVVRNEKPLAKKLLFDLEGLVDYERFFSNDTQNGATYYHYMRTHFGIVAGFDKELALERAGKLADAEKMLLSFTMRPKTYLPLGYFYERQGMRDKLMAMDLPVAGYILRDMVAMDIATAPPEVLGEVAAFYPMMGDWDKAEAAAKRFDQLRPMNFIGKEILLLCAIHNHDPAGEKAAVQEMTSLKTDRPVYRAVQPILTGSDTWDQDRDKADLKKYDPYLGQGIIAVALNYVAQGNKAEARTVIEQSVPNCAENSARTLLQSLLYGSLAYLTAPDAPAPAMAGQQPSPAANQPAPITATIAANSPDGYPLGPVSKGTKITFQYVSGMWKGWGRVATANPDGESPEGGKKSRVAIAQPGTSGTLGDVVTLVPAGTAYTPFVFQAQQDYPALILRINYPSPSKGPGQVVYNLTIVPPPK